MLKAFFIGLLSSLVAAISLSAYAYRHCFVGSVKCFLFHRQRDVRISMAALISVSKGGRFLLVRNEYRPESFGPIGGVFKYYSSAQESLDRYCFLPQTRGERDPNELETDLRGFIPGRRLPAFIKWFVSGKHREVEPLTREILEELTQIGLNARSLVRSPFKFELIRSVYEGPVSVPGVHYAQFRYLKIYRFAIDCTEGAKLTAVLFDTILKNPHLISVTAEEIRTGRATSGELIGDHTHYLISDRRIRSEPPPFA